MPSPPVAISHRGDACHLRHVQGVGGRALVDPEVGAGVDVRVRLGDRRAAAGACAPACAPAPPRAVSEVVYARPLVGG
jgi:hypothetical protein